MALLIGDIIVALAAAGDLDTTFGITSSGMNYTDINGAGATDRIFALALQTDDKTIAAGLSDAHFAVARYETNGLLDTTFGAPNGYVTTAINSSSVAYGAAVQTDGKVVVVGASNDGVRDYFTVARYNTNGTLDTTGFNAPTGYIVSTLSAVADVATSVVLQTDGKIVVAGYANDRFAVARYHTNGVLDTAGFNAPNGYRVFPIGGANDQAQAVGLQSDGKIILAGHADNGKSDDFAVARVTTSGALDTTFNGGLGFILTDFPTQAIDLAQALAIQPDDKIVVVGYTSPGPTEDFALARYNANGALDTAFGANGRATASLGVIDQAFAVALQPTGRIVVAGTTNDPTTKEDFAIARFTSGGALDTTFGGGDGWVSNNVGDSLAAGAITADYVEAAVIQSDNKIVVGGATDHPLSTGDDNFAIARYESPNESPTVTTFAKSTNEDIALTFTGADFSTNFSDADGDSPMKVEITSLPVNGILRLSGVDVVINQEILAFNLGSLTYHPTINTSGSDTFSWNASDGLSYAVSDAAVDISIAAVNDAPVNSVPVAFDVNEDTARSGLVFSIADVDVGAASTFRFTLSASNGNLTLASTTGLTLLSGGNGSHLMTYQGTLANIQSALGSVAYQGDANYSGADTISLTANDNGNTGSGGAQTDLDTVAVTVNAINDAPVLTAIGNQSGNEQTLITFDANASDVDTAQTLSFSLDPGAPGGASINASSGVFSWTPTEAQGPGVYTVTVRVTDNGSPVLGDFETLAVTVAEVNTPPMLAAIGNQAGDEGTNITFDANASDSDLPSQTLTFSLDAGAPVSASINSASGVFSWTPAENRGPGVYPVTVRVSDGTVSDSETISITVNEVNSAPTLDPIGNKSGDEVTVISFTASASDSDLPGQSLSYSLDVGAPAGAGINGSSGVFTWTPTEAQGPGVYPVTVRVTDNGSPALDDFETLNITVTEVNTAPVLAAIGAQAGDEQTSITFDANASDGDSPANTLTFLLDAGAPAGAGINASSGVFTWTPTEAQGPGTYPVTVRVTDHGSPALDDFETITVTVNEVNLAPVLNAIANQNVNEGSLLSLTATAADADLPANSLAFTLADGAPAGAGINASTGQFTWTPSEAQGPGVYPITVRVDDGAVPNLFDTTTFTVTVNDVNNAPLLAAIGAQAGNEQTPITFDANASDTDLPAQTLTFSLDPGAPAGASINATTGVFSWTPTEAQGPGVYTVTVRVADDGSPVLGDFETLAVTVAEVNTPPLLAAIGNQSGDESTSITFDADASDSDLPSQTLTFSLDAGAPAGASIDPASGEFFWTPSEARGPDVYTVTVRVSDGALEDFEAVTITVNEVDTAPTLHPIGDQVVNEDQNLSLTVTASDPDLPIQILTFSLDAGAPMGVSINPFTGLLSWAPGELDSPGVYTVTVRVTDDSALSDSETLQITVSEVNDGPSFTVGENQVVNEDAGAQTVIGWATNITPGPGDEATQALTFVVSPGDPTLFSAQPVVNPTTGSLSYTPAANVNGSTTVSIHLRDNGGTANGGDDSSDTGTFTITVKPINDAPTLANIAKNGAAGESIQLTLADFTAAFSDVDGDALLLLRIATLPAHGVLQLNGGLAPVGVGFSLTAGDVLTFVPDSGWSGNESFDWNASDGAAYASANAQVNITIAQPSLRIVYLPVIAR